MPIKQCVCSICGSTVNKAVTYHVGDGKRACKAHEGVTSKAEELAKKELDRIKDQREKAKPKEKHPLNTGDPFKSKCWRCGVEGIYEQEWFLNRLVEMEKADIMAGKPLNPFDPNHPMYKNQKVCIYRLPKEVLAGGRMEKMPRVSNQLIEISGLVCLCTGCMSIMKIEPPKPKDVSLEKMMKLGAIYEVTLKPAVHAQAVAEIIRDN